MLTTRRLRQLFDYRQETGELVRIVATSRRSKVGEVAGFVGKNGYLYASVDGETYPLHRLVWVWHGNEVSEIDHLNNIRSDNRIENLRVATRSQNMWNTGLAKNNTSGVKGVSWKKDKEKFRVRIQAHGKRIHIGDFEDIELAELAAIDARAKYHGQFANS